MTLGIRRISILALCIAVMMTTVGFACLVFAASALGMPAGHGMVGCGMPTQSAVACPHDNPAESTAPSLADTTPQMVAAVAQASFITPPLLSAVAGSPDSGPVPEPPVAHLTPLRI